MTTQIEAPRTNGQGKPRPFPEVLRHFVYEPQMTTELKRWQEWNAFWARIDSIMEGFTTFSLQAQDAGLEGEELDAAVRRGMVDGGLIDKEDPKKAADEYRLISEGYKANIPFWKERLKK